MLNLKRYRLFINTGLLFLYSLCSNAQNTLSPEPNAKQLAWQKAEFGVIFHYDLHVFDHAPYNQGQNRITPVTDYNIFNPIKLNVRQWVAAAKAAGARFAILTATHETGFALFQSDYNPYGLKALKWADGKGDLVRDFVTACRKYGIKPGIYLGIRWNSFFGVRDFKVDGNGDMQKKRQQYYNTMVEGMVKEICSNYGPLFEIWFDGGAGSPEKGAPDVLPIVKKYQPDCLFYHNDQLAEARWGGTENGTVGYPCWSTFTFHSTGAGENLAKTISENKNALLKHGDMNGGYWVPAMADAPLRGFNNRHEWFWEPGDEKGIYPLGRLIDMYYASVGRNATLVLGVTPDDTGLLPNEDVLRLNEFGKEIHKRFAHPIANVSGTGNKINIILAKPSLINQISISEDIAQGEKIRSYQVEGKVDGKWQILCQGTAVGNKRLQVFKPVLATQVRLVVDKSLATPVITSFRLYYIESDQTIRN